MEFPVVAHRRLSPLANLVGSHREDFCFFFV